MLAPVGRGRWTVDVDDDKDEPEDEVEEEVEEDVEELLELEDILKLALLTSLCHIS